MSADVARRLGERHIEVRGTATGRLARRVGRADLQTALVVTLVSSAVIHLAVTPAHMREYFAFGVFFIVAAVAQLGAALWCRRRASRASTLVALALSAVIAAVWLVSRTTGLPIGPEAGEAEAIGLADVVSTVYELMSVVAAGALVVGLGRGEALRMRWTTRSATWATFAGWITVGAIYAGGH